LTGLRFDIWMDLSQILVKMAAWGCFTKAPLQKYKKDYIGIVLFVFLFFLKNI